MVGLQEGRKKLVCRCCLIRAVRFRGSVMGFCRKVLECDTGRERGDLAGAQKINASFYQGLKCTQNHS